MAQSLDTLIPETRYARSGNHQIAYQVSGRGGFDLVWVPDRVSHLDLWWQLPGATASAEVLGDVCRLIRFDKRGTGLSDRPSTTPTLEERSDDIRAVMDAAGSERAVIFGRVDGGAMACMFAATHPERTRLLILDSVSARWLSAPEYPWGISEERYAQAGRELIEEWPPDWYTSASLFPADADLVRRYFRAAASPAAAAALFQWNAEIDIRDIVPTIQAPTLVFSRRSDARATAAGRDLAQRIPGARFHALVAEDVDERWQELARAAILFVQEQLNMRIPQLLTTRVLATVLGLDIVGSTGHVARLGDAAWAQLLGRFYQVVQDELIAHAGTEVDRAGDGLLATFEGPGRAIQCAKAIATRAGTLGIRLRAGVHTGEIERSGKGIRGVAVHIAARVTALAASDEILATSTVRDLVAGSQLRFEDRGLQELKGISEARQVFRVLT